MVIPVLWISKHGVRNEAVPIKLSVKQAQPVLKGTIRRATADCEFSSRFPEQVVVGDGHPRVVPVYKAVDIPVPGFKVEYVPYVFVIIPPLPAHLHVADGSRVTRSHDEDVVLDPVAYALCEDALVSPGANHTVDDVVGNGEVIGGIVQVDPALEVEHRIPRVVDEVVVIYIVTPRPP